MGGWGPEAQALFVRTPQRRDREQMWEGRRLGSQPEQLGEIKNNSIPGDWGNYSRREGGREGRSERQRESFRAMWSLTRVSVEYKRLNRQGGFKGTILQWLAKANKLQLCFQWKHEHICTYAGIFIPSTNTEIWQFELRSKCEIGPASDWASNCLRL